MKLHRIILFIGRVLLTPAILFLTVPGLRAQVAGGLDPVFNPNAGDAATVHALAVQLDGKILVGGQFPTISGQSRTNLARLNADGSLESLATFSTAGTDESVNSVAIQPDGKILVAGGFNYIAGLPRSRIARLKADGSVEGTNIFNPGSINGAVNAVAVQPDGKILIGGGFYFTVNGVPHFNITRLNPNGSLESSVTFARGGISDIWAGSVYCFAVQPDGKILVAGAFTQAGGFSCNRIVRLNSDGKFDFNNNFFSGTGGANGTIYCMALQPDGKILISGDFTSVNSTGRNRIARLNADGTVDTSFDPGTGLNNPAYGIALQADGKIIVGGHFSSVNGSPRDGMARLDPNGVLESTGTFNAAAASALGDTVLVRGLALQADGKILVGGGFTTFNGTTRKHLARLTNGPATSSFTIPSQETVQWLRGGTAPEFTTVTFEVTTNGGANYTSLGTGSYFTGGWALNNLNLEGIGSVRARGRTAGGEGNASSSFLETNAPFNFVPEIAVTQPAGNNLVDGLASINFNIVTIGAASAAKVFTVTNPGTGKLNLGTITINGSNAADFHFTQPGAIVIAPGGSTTFTATFSPRARGTHNAALHLPSNDGDENPFDIALTGVGVSDNANLSNLVFSAGSFAPAFAAAKTNYTAIVPLAVTNVTVTPTLADVFATLTVNGSSSASGSASAPIALFGGSNLITVAVTAEDGTTTKTYRLTVIPTPGTNANLADLTLSSGNYTPAFSPGPASYAASVANTTSNLTVTATVADPTSTLKVNGTTVASGNVSQSINLTVGANPITVVVTAQDNLTKKTNSITVTRAATPVVPTGPGGPPGSVDSNFVASATGLYIRTATLQPDGKIIIGGDITSVNGQPRNNIARLNADGSLESTNTFNPGTGPNNQVLSAVVQPDGKILIAGYFTAINGQSRNRIARLNADGTLESAATFSASATGLYGALLQTNGKIVLWGLFTNVNGSARNRIARLNADGSLESTNTFNVGTGANDEIDGAALQADGKILIGGNFSSVNGQPRNRIARLNADGTVESTATFNPGTGVGGGRCFSIVPQADGKILIAGEFASVDGQPRGQIARLNTNGTVESTGTFNPGSGAQGGEVRSVVVQADGKILLGGFFTGVNGEPRNCIARLNSDGTLDNLTNFNLGTGVENGFYPVLNVSLQADGKVLLGGQFTTVDGQTHNHLVRLNNDPATGSLTNTSSARVQWLRGGGAPEIERVTFELSTNGGGTWSALGAGTRIAGGWERTGLSLPTSNLIRGRGRTSGGDLNFSGGLVEMLSVALSSAAVTNGNLAVVNTNGGSQVLSINSVTVGGTNYIQLNDAQNSLVAGAGAVQVNASTIRVTASSVTGEVTLTGGAGDDHFVLDATAGCALPPGGLNINGGGQATSAGDTLTIKGAYSSVTYSANNVGAGTIMSDCGMVKFTGLEPVDYTSANLVNLAVNVDPSNLFAGTITTTLSQMSGETNTGMTTVDFSGGLELMNFNALSGTLTITGDSTEPDTILLQGVGSNFAGNLVIAAQAADAVMFTNGSITLGAGKNLDVTAGSVTLGNVTFSGGTISFNGGSVQMNIGGRTPGSAANQYSRFTVNGGILLSNNPVLNLYGSYGPRPGDSFMLITNDSGDAIVGTFAGLPEGATLEFNGMTFSITYTGGDGNDVVITSTLAYENHAPVVDASSNFTVNPGDVINFLATASDDDDDDLTFTLANPPVGADINLGGGFTWRPLVAKANTINTVKVVVTDDGTPNLSGTNTFTVTVNPIAPVVLTPVSYNAGVFQFNVSGTTGPDYIIVTSTNLTTWSDLTTNFSPVTPFPFIATPADAARSHFYRARLAP